MQWPCVIQQNRFIIRDFYLVKTQRLHPIMICYLRLQYYAINYSKREKKWNGFNTEKRVKIHLKSLYSLLQFLRFLPKTGCCKCWEKLLALPLIFNTIYNYTTSLELLKLKRQPKGSSTTTNCYCMTNAYCFYPCWRQHLLELLWLSRVKGRTL